MFCFVKRVVFYRNNEEVRYRVRGRARRKWRLVREIKRIYNSLEG